MDTKASAARGARDFILGGASATVATLFTNPLEVVKTRMQLQGELKVRGNHAVYYRNVLHALYAITKTDGFVALYYGLSPNMGFQLCLNSCRLGVYRICERNGLTTKEDGSTAIIGSIVAGSVGGTLGGITGSPFNFVKTRLQAQASPSIAVGHQHVHTGMMNAFRNIYKTEGLRGLFRGVQTQIPRCLLGTASQLLTYNLIKDYFQQHQLLKDSKLLTSFIGANVAGVIMVAFMNPFDVVGTRLYNQGLDARGRGLLYNGMVDCFIKQWKTEGPLGFYKGVGPSYLRLGPHNVIVLMVWDQLKAIEQHFKFD